MMQIREALEIASLTDPGRLRKRNEDYVAERPESGLVLLADGMGGYNAGDVASGMATDLVAEGIGQDWQLSRLAQMDRPRAQELAAGLIRQHVARANNAVHQAAQHTPEYSGMGTTLVVGLFFDNLLTVGHVGDSRLYRLRAESLDQLTRDHSLLQEQIDQGVISKEEARLSHNKNLVTRALGVDPAVEAEVHTHTVAPGDMYLLCSDGLNDMIDDEEIRLTLLTLKSNVQLAAQHLVQAANDSGGRDNISVVLVKVLNDFEVTRSWLVRLKSWFKR
jgi:PPM family protein phosphatase